MYLKIKAFFTAAWRFIKLKPAIAAVPAALLGVAAAAAVTIIVVKHFNSGAPDRYFSSIASVSSAIGSVAEPQEVIETQAPVIQPVEKQVSYKGKKINVAAVEVAKPDSKEDSENGSYVKEKPESVTEIASNINIYESKSNAGYVYGIDVSSHNGSIDWAAVKQSGIQFAMIRCGYRGYLTGKIVMDACFEYNIINAYKNGIPVGVYFYSTAVNETEAVEEAAYVVELVKTKAASGIKLSYPIAYDFEEFYNNDDRSRAKTLSKKQISSDAAAFLDYIKSSGYTPMFYAGKNPMKNNFEAYLATKYNFWLANYANATEYEGKFFMWQYTSSGQISGISGRVDLNVCGFENNDNLERFSVCNRAGAVAYKKPDSSSEVVLTLKTDEIYLYRNTYNSNFKEIKVDGKYCYVPTADLNSPFTVPSNKYQTSTAEDIYKYPVLNSNYKSGGVVPADTELDVRGIWENKWAEIKYDGVVCYIKADKLITGDEIIKETLPTETEETPPSEPPTDESGSSPSDMQSDDSTFEHSTSDTDTTESDSSENTVP